MGLHGLGLHWLQRVWLKWLTILWFINFCFASNVTKEVVTNFGCQYIHCGFVDYIIKVDLFRNSMKIGWIWIAVFFKKLKFSDDESLDLFHLTLPEVKTPINLGNKFRVVLKDNCSFYLRLFQKFKCGMKHFHVVTCYLSK